MEQYKFINNFTNNLLSDKKYHRHCDLDTFINIKLTGIYNLENLLSEDEKKLIFENFGSSSKYLTEIDSEKQQLNSQINQRNSAHSLLNFKFPKFEIFFTAKLIINNNEIEPEVITDLCFNNEINETLMFRYKLKDITQDSKIKINVYTVQMGSDKVLLASTILQFFTPFLNMMQGKHVYQLTKVNNEVSKEYDNATTIKDDYLYELDQLVNNYYNNFNNKNINDNYLEKDKVDFSSYFNKKLTSILNNSDYGYLEVLFPVFNFPIVYEEEKIKINYYKNLKIKDINNGPAIRFDNWVADIEIRKGKNLFSKDNPITEKFSILSRISDDAFSRDIRPSHVELSRIEELLTNPDFIKLDDSDTILFWKYRYFLLNRKYALTKILNAVKWGDSKSENEFIQNILEKWTEVETSDILYMLSFKFCVNPIYSKIVYSKMNEVRNFAIKNLQKSQDVEINFILLQLVQALRYEDHNVNDNSLRKFLINRCKSNVELATSLFWFLCVEADDSIVSKNKESNDMIQVYKQILNDFMESLQKYGENTNIESNQNFLEIKEILKSQTQLREKLIAAAQEIKKVNRAEQKKLKLIQIVKKDGLVDMHKFINPLTLPLDPNIKLTGVIADSSRVFSSAKYPMKMTFSVTNESQKYLNKEDPHVYDLMFKFGDDLRQDQLILQMIACMDNLLKNVHLDFEFTSYKVLATSKSDGFVEFVPNTSTVYDILKENNDQILPFLKQLSSSSNLGIERILESFINSCAGYCVVTYILGIGDRHLENLLVDRKGRLFHIDFGYILGKDPKPYPPPMKLCKQMVDCMGGKGSHGYELFKKKCIDAYLYLRSNCKLIVNMFYLMIHCGINELSENSENVLNKLHEKFVPNMNVQQASNTLINKLEESVSGMIPYLMDQLHDLANKFK